MALGNKCARSWSFVMRRGDNWTGVTQVRSDSHARVSRNVNHLAGSKHGCRRRRSRKVIRMIGTKTHNAVLRDVVAALAVSGMVVSLAGHASGATFEKAINPNYSYTEDVQQTSDGGYVVGATFSNTTYVALIAKLDSSGNLQWQKQYQSSVGGSEVYAVKQTLDGGYVWAGELQNSNGSDCAIVTKLDSSGNITWQQTYGVAANAADIRQTVDGGYIVGGVTPIISGMNPAPFMIVEGWIAKLDASGKVQWQKVVSSSQNVTINSVIQTADGGYAVTGLANANVLVAKSDANGNLKWQTVYTSPSGLGIGYSIVQTSDGGYMVGGCDNDSPFLGLALKLGSNGHVQWAKTYYITGAASEFFSVRQTSDGGFAFSGQFYTGVGYYYGYNAWMVRTDAAGSVQWQKAYGSPNYAASFQKVGLTSDGGLVAGGYTLEFNNQNEAYIVKTDSGGQVSNCSDVQVTTATTTGLSETASAAKLSISSPTNIASAGKVSESVTLFTLATECSGN
jgi:hypothetical protein